MKLLAFETVTSEGKHRHLGALIEGDADTGQIIDLTSASRALLASQGVSKEESERVTDLLCPPSTLRFIEGGGRAREHAEKAVEQERELEDSEILESAADFEAQAMTAWKHDNPNSSLKFQRRLLDNGVIDHLPWEDYLKPQADFVDEAAVEAKKWADENPDTEESAKAKEWAEERGVSDVSWMEHDEQGNQIKRIKENYQQNAEQNERTIWQRIQDAKK